MNSQRIDRILVEWIAVMVLPALPLVMEKILTGGVSEGTRMITPAIYGMTVAAAAKWRFIGMIAMSVSVVCAAAYGVSLMELPADAEPLGAVPDSDENIPEEATTRSRAPWHSVWASVGPVAGLLVAYLFDFLTKTSLEAEASRGPRK